MEDLVEFTVMAAIVLLVYGIVFSSGSYTAMAVLFALTGGLTWLTGKIISRWFR